MAKETILLLHGALGCFRQFDDFRSLYDEHTLFPAYEFPGYGQRAEEHSFKNLSELAEDLCAFLDSHDLNNITAFGHSMGGYIAVLAEKSRPGSFKTIITLGTKWSWNEVFALQEIQKLNLDILKEKAPWFVERMESYHGKKNLNQVFEYTSGLMNTLGKNPLIYNLEGLGKKVKCLIVRGGKDRMVTEEESLELSKTNPGSKYLCIEGWKHPFEEVPVIELRQMIGKVVSQLGS